MPYKITVVNDVLHLALMGCITPKDIVSYTDELKKYEENVDVVPHRITDMSGAEELAVHYPDISLLAAIRGQSHFPNSFKSAIIARSSYHMGYARMFQSLNTNPQIVIRIFPDEESANKWIASPGDFTSG